MSTQSSAVPRLAQSHTRVQSPQSHELTHIPSNEETSANTSAHDDAGSNVPSGNHTSECPPVLSTYQSKTIPQLKLLLVERKLPVSGTKPLLIERLMNYDNGVIYTPRRIPRTISNSREQNISQPTDQTPLTPSRRLAINHEYTPSPLRWHPVATPGIHHTPTPQSRRNRRKL